MTEIMSDLLPTNSRLNLGMTGMMDLVGTGDSANFIPSTLTLSSFEPAGGQEQQRRQRHEQQQHQATAWDHDNLGLGLIESRFDLVRHLDQYQQKQHQHQQHQHQQHEHQQQQQRDMIGRGNNSTGSCIDGTNGADTAAGVGAGRTSGGAGAGSSGQSGGEGAAATTAATAGVADRDLAEYFQRQPQQAANNSHHHHPQHQQQQRVFSQDGGEPRIAIKNEDDCHQVPQPLQNVVGAAAASGVDHQVTLPDWCYNRQGSSPDHAHRSHQYQYEHQQQQQQQLRRDPHRRSRNYSDPPPPPSLIFLDQQPRHQERPVSHQQRQQQQHCSTDNPSPADASLFTPPSSSTLTAITANTTTAAAAAVGPSLSSFSSGSQSQLQSQYYHHLAAHQRQRQQQQQQRQQRQQQQQRQYHYPHQQRYRYRHQFHSTGLDSNGGSNGSGGPPEIGAAIVNRVSDSDSDPAPVSASVPLGGDEGGGGGGSGEGGGGSGECVRGAAVAVGQPRAAGSISVSDFGVDLGVGVGVGVDDCAGGTRFDNGIGIFPGELLHGVAAVAAAAADHHRLQDLQDHLHNQYHDHNQDQQQQHHHHPHHHQFEPVITAPASSQSPAGRSLAAIMAITQLASSTSSSAQSPSQPPPRHDQSDPTGSGSESLVLAPLPEPVRQQQHPHPHPQQQQQQHPQSAPHQDHQPAPQQHQQQQQHQQRHASPPILNQITPALAAASSATSIAAAAAAVAAVATPTLSVASLIIPHPDRRSPVFPSAALHPALAPLPGTVPIAPHTPPTTATISPDVLVRKTIDSRHREHEQDQQDQQQQQQQAAEKKGHQRVYQACIPCRRRKVRCDLGSVDNPSDPPCQRCLRESKDCYFSATRRKRKNEEGDGGASDEIDEYIIRNGRKRVNQSGSPLDRKMFSEIPLTPGGTAGRTQPLRRPTDESGSGSGSGTRPGDLGSDESNNTQLENLEAQTVMRREVYGPHDALDLLYKAATDSPTANHKRSSSTTTISQPLQPPQPPPPPQLQQPQPPGHHHPQPHHQHQHQHQHQNQNQNQSVLIPAAAIQRKPSAPDGQPDSRPVKAEPAMADPGLRFRSVGASSVTTTTTHEYHPDAIKAWSRFRFVRAGWFTAQEAIEYIKYYYVYLSPLTPISPPTFQDEASHITLLTEEPVLTVTLLTIASRYRELPGTGGHCRSLSIHEKLWSYLHRMIERCFWGQEDFGGVMPAGPSGEDYQGGSTAPSRGLKKGSLRTLGTIESLLILTEWHPRALYFPPDEAIYELMLPSPGYGDPEPFEDAASAAAASAAAAGGSGGGGAPRLENWLEPAWRSDRMCWMLLSTAMGLAYELGVYDDVEELLRDGAILRPEYEEEAYRQRAHRVKRLLTIYMTQLAGRLGWTNMAPGKFWQTDPAAAASAASAAEVATGAHGRRRPVSHEGGTPFTALSTLSVGFNYIPDLELDDQIIHCWAGISSAMNLGNQKLFKSHKHTTEIIQSGRYIDLLREFQPMLRDWWKEFERFRLPLYIRHILTIEYEYVRIYINSLSLQAVVERCTSNAGSGSGGGGTTAADSAAQLSPQTRKYFGKLPLGQLGGFSAADKQYVREVIDGCRNLLRTVVDGLLPRGYLKHAPIRTYLRIINGAIFLLKTFTLGAARADVKISIDLMDSTVEALRNCVVDDVHIGIRFADLLESLTSRLRNRFIQAPPMSAAMAMAATGPGSDMGDVNSPLPNHSDVVMGNGVGQAGNRDWGGKVGEDFYAADRQSTPGISATPFDLRAGNFPYQSGIAATLNPSSSTPANLDQHPQSHSHSLLHPHQHNVNHGGPAGTGGAGLMLDSWDHPGEMWYLPPGPAFFQNMENNAVSMTAEGVNVGGIDLLDYIVMEPQGYGADSY